VVGEVKRRVVAPHAVASITRCTSRRCSAGTRKNSTGVLHPWLPGRSPHGADLRQRVGPGSGRAADGVSPGILPEGLVALWPLCGFPRRPIDVLEQVWRAYPQARERFWREEQHEPLPLVRLDLHEDACSRTRIPRIGI